METSLRNYPILLLVSVICYPFILLTAVGCAIYYFFINTYLKIKYKDNFGGMVQSSDAIWTVEAASRCIINVTVIVETASKNPEDIKRSVKTFIHNNVFKNPDTFPKLTYICSTFMGYSFYIKNLYTVDECVKSLEYDTEEEEIDNRILMQTMSQHSNLPLPKDQKALWEVLVSSKPIKWPSTKERTYHFAVIFRMSHIFGDALSIFTLLKQNFSVVHYQKELTKKVLKIKEKYKLLKVIRDNIRFLPTILIFPAIFFYQYFIMESTVYGLHGKKLSGETNFVYNLETEKELVQMIKKIKCSMPETCFTDVIFTATSNAVAQYYKRKSYNVPKRLLATIPILMETPSCDKRTTVENDFSFGILDLPILLESDWLKRLEEVTKHGIKMRDPYLLQVYYWALRWLFGIIPKPLLNKLCLLSNKCTLFLTNLPGVQTKICFCDNYEVKDIFLFLPHKGLIGIGLGIFSHFGRLQVTLNVDKALVPEEEDAQFIVDMIVHSIVSMYKHIS